jgi:hypothetical protein
MSITIEHGIKPRPYGYQDPKYPFREMAVGDSFFYHNPRQIRVAAAMFAKRHPGYKFTTRKVDGGIRVWRISNEK